MSGHLWRSLEIRRNVWRSAAISGDLSPCPQIRPISGNPPRRLAIHRDVARAVATPADSSQRLPIRRNVHRSDATSPVSTQCRFFRRGSPALTRRRPLCRNVAGSAAPPPAPRRSPWLCRDGGSAGVAQGSFLGRDRSGRAEAGVPLRGGRGGADRGHRLQRLAGQDAGSHPGSLRARGRYGRDRGIRGVAPHGQSRMASIFLPVPLRVGPRGRLCQGAPAAASLASIAI
jgi:hypothetical protein